MTEKLGDATPGGGDPARRPAIWAEANGSRWTSGNRPRPSRAFVQDKLIPAIAEVNPDAPQAAEPEILEVHDLQQA